MTADTLLTWSDDRLLHELTWAAEALCLSMESKGASIHPETAQRYTDLKDWLRGVRSEWNRRAEAARQEST